MADFYRPLSQIRNDALLGGGDVRIQKQHQKGKGTTRERIAALAFDGRINDLSHYKLLPEDIFTS